MGGKMPVFRKLCVREQLAVEREYPRLLPCLLRWGLPPEDALAVAHNATLLHAVLEAEPALQNPAAVLERYSLGELADLCALYAQVEAGELEYGEATT